MKGLFILLTGLLLWLGSIIGLGSFFKFEGEEWIGLTLVVSLGELLFGAIALGFYGIVSSLLTFFF